jgi:chromosome segregation ATPase
VYLCFLERSQNCLALSCCAFFRILYPLQSAGFCDTADPEFLTYHAGWALTARYAQHVSSMLQEATTTSAHLRLHLEERAGQRKAQDRAVKTLQKGNRELVQQNACLETRIRELNDELMRTYRSHDFKTDSLDDTCTRLQHALDDLTAAQSYVHHLKTELHERDEQLEASHDQVANL